MIVLSILLGGKQSCKGPGGEIVACSSIKSSNAIEHHAAGEYPLRGMACSLKNASSEIGPKKWKPKLSPKVKILC